MTTPAATCPPALVPRIRESGLESFMALVNGSWDYWDGVARRGALPWDVAGDWWRWMGAMHTRRRPAWATPHRIAMETDVVRLRDFSDAGSDKVVPTLIFPPQAGHDSCIVDYSQRQSQIKTIKAAGLTRLWSLDWIGATQRTKDRSILDYMASIDHAVELIGGDRINLVGDCQGGWLATIWAALHPERVHTLTIAGAPIDFHAGEPVIGDYVDLLPREFYEQVVALGDGVMKGDFMLNGFITIKPESEIEKQMQLLAHIHEPEHLDRYAAFEDWFKHTQDIPGAFYLWIVEHLFRDNGLIRGTLDIAGERADLSSLDAPLYLLGGATDHITPPDQVFALADHTSTPAREVTKRVTSGGHLGLFMGTEALRDHWPPLMADVAKRSRGPASRSKAKARTPGAPNPIPAP